MAVPSLDHPYIEEHKIAERFVRGELTAQERESFARHYTGCPECTDRVALAKIFHVETQSADARKRVNKGKPQVGLFSVLATFAPRQQAAIFAISTMALLLMPIFALNWLDTRASAPQPAGEQVVSVPPTGAVEARIAPGSSSITLAAAMPGAEGLYRLSIVDVNEKPLITGPDQASSRGVSLGLRLPSLPPGVTFVLVEKRAENGAYSMVSRHPLLIEWR